MKELQLHGYFNRNFGDDFMVKAIVRQFPHITFFVSPTASVDFLKEETNVVFADHKIAPVLLVIGSGFMINSKAALLTEIVWWLRKKHPGDFCFGLNTEPLSGILKKTLIRHKLNQFRLLICRDKATEAYLCAKTRKPDVRYLPDPVFSLPLTFPSSEEKLLGIVVMPLKESYMTAMADAADLYIENTDKNVLLIALSVGTENDTAACENILSRMKHPHRAEIIAYQDGSEILSAYGRCEKIITARFHGAVLAIKAGIPLFPVITRNKMKHLLSDFSYPERGCAADEIHIKDLTPFILKTPKMYSLSDDIEAQAGSYAAEFENFLSKELKP